MPEGDLKAGQRRLEFGFRWLFLLALSMGALTGFLEGVGLYGAQARRWLGVGIFGSVAEPAILYLSPISGLLVFGAVALLLQIFFLAFRIAETTRIRVTLGVLCALGCFDWLWLSEGFALYGAIILAIGLGCASERWFRRRWEKAFALAPKMLGVSVVYICVVALGLTVAARRHEAEARAALPAARPGSPNIVLVILDTVRADHLSVYGYSRKTSPFLEKLAAQGVAFDNAVAPSSWTFPSHVSMLTGRYPHEHGAELNAYDGRFATVASSFDQLGYLTAGFSGNRDWFAAARGMTVGFQHFEDAYWSVASMLAQTGYGNLANELLGWATHDRVVIGYKRAGDVNRTALRWLDSAPKRPFFLVVNYYDANAGGAEPRKGYRRMFSSAPLPPPARAADEFLPAEIDKGRSDEYDGALVYEDGCVRELVEALKERGLADNLVVIVTSDHGEMLGEHGLHGHRNALYWDLIHVPLIFWGNGVPAQGERVEQPVSLISLPATLLDLAGGKGMGSFPAPTMTALWNTSGDVPSWPLPISELAEMHYPGREKLPNYSGSMAAIVTPQWLLIDHSMNGPALYDWSADPENLHDLADTTDGESFATALAGCLLERDARLPGAGCRVEEFRKPKTPGPSEAMGAAGEE